VHTRSFRRPAGPAPGPGGRLWRLAQRTLNRDTWAAYQEMAPREWWSPESLREYQLEATREVVAHAWAHNRFYRDLWTRARVTPETLRTLDDLRRFPIVEKQLLRDALADGTGTSDDVREPVHVLASTGSTGEPFQFPLDETSAQLRRALTFRTRQACGYYDGDRNAKLWRTDSREGWKARAKKRYLYRLLELSVYDDADPEGSTLDDRKLRDIALAVKRYRPRVLEGYVSALTLLARFVLEDGVGGVHPAAVLTGGEVLDPAERELLERAFDAPVWNRYGGTEGGTLAHECGRDDAHRLHLQSDAGVTEFIRDDEPARPGEPGDIVITSFHSRSLPLIRYRVGDLGVPEDPDVRCACGRGLPLVREIVGRVNDVFHLEGGRTLSSHVFHKVFRGTRSIRRFQIVQKDLDLFEVRIEPAAQGVDEPELREVREKVARYLHGARVVWREVEHLAPGPGGKLRQCVSEVDGARADRWARAL